MSDRDNITLPREVADYLMEVLEESPHHGDWSARDNVALAALRTALAAEQPKQEPVAWQERHFFPKVGEWTHWYDCRPRMADYPREQIEQNGVRYQWRPLYPAPPDAPTVKESLTHPGYIIGNHWFETAYERLCAGEAEDAILEDYELVREPRLRDLRRDAERFWMVVAAMNEKPKPVAWMFVNLDGECEQIEYGTPPTDDDSITPLYIAPPEDEALRRDAERYRWLRERAWFQFEFEGRYGDSGETVQELDAAIDAAMEASTAPASAAADSSTAPEAKP